MRKKSTADVTTPPSNIVSRKVIAKKSRTHTSGQTAGENCAAVHTTSDTVLSNTSHPDRACPHVYDVGDDNMSPTGSRERSGSPVESDLLRYLTVHITPPFLVDSTIKGSSCSDVTTFVIERGEYLEGIVRLIQSDCPEVALDVASFTQAMQAAFRTVKDLKPHENVTDFNI
jgi:hypothetical protein